MNVPASQAVAFAAGFPPSVLVVFYDQSGTEATLAAVSQALSGGGLASAYALRGGLDLWQRTYNKTPLVVAGMDNSWGTFLDASGARAYVPSAALRTMDITQLRRRYYVLVDIRTPSAFATGHLAGATNISEAGVEAFVETLAQGVAVIIYSDDGSTSDGIANNLRVQGINAKSLLGGFAEWQKQHGSFLVVASAG